MTLPRTSTWTDSCRISVAAINLFVNRLANNRQEYRSTLQKWEQGERDPDGASHTLLRVMEKEPEAVKRALHG